MNGKLVNVLTILLLFCFSSMGQKSGVVQRFDEQPKEKNNYYAEIAKVSSALGSNPSNSKLLQQRASYYMMVGEFDQAILDIDAAISIDGNNGDNHYTKSLILYKRKKYDEAIVSADNAIAVNNKVENYYFLRANLFALQKKYREAVKDLNSILEINVFSDYCYLQKAIWCGYLGMFYDQIINFNYYLELSKDDNNKMIVKDKLVNLKKSDKYLRDLSEEVGKDIRKNGYPWDARKG